jgi:hypothetical protein
MNQQPAAAPSLANNLKRRRNAALLQAKRAKNMTLQTLLRKLLNTYGLNSANRNKLVSAWVGYQAAVNNRNIKKNVKAAEAAAQKAGANLANAAFSINSKTPPPPYDPVRIGLKKGVKGRVVYWAPGVLRRSLLGF